MKDEKTQLKELVNQLKNANEELERFAYVASHDLKAPLRAISSLAGWISEDISTGSISEDTQAHLKLLMSRVARMNKLLDDLLTYAKVGKGERIKENISIDDLVKSVLDMLPIKKFEILVEADVTEIVAERVPLEQVLVNLIENSIKHHNKKSGTITVAISNKKGWLEFTVTDDGPGIPESQQVEAFDMFRTLKPRDEVEGSGMGLALVKKIVETQGGTIGIVPSKKGLSVRFTFPKQEFSNV